MSMLEALGRPMLASMFLWGGADSLRNPESKVKPATRVVDPLAHRSNLALDTAQLVRVNGAVQVLGGVALATGTAPRLAATALAASLVPTTAAGHRFWEEQDAATRRQQKIHFLKNVSMLGGLLAVAGAPSSRR